MLLPDDIHPESTLFYNGALILRALAPSGSAKLLDLYLEAKSDSKMTMPLFVLSLDWLFLVNCVTINDQGVVSLCS